MRAPLSTYRLQFAPAFDFADGEAILDYLAALGVSDVYASPIFAAQAGSEHGYDVVDPNAINAELGGESAFEGVARAAHDRGLGWLQDIVPNHMAFQHENRMLMDILESGERSTYLRFFDIDWTSHHAALRGRLLAPVLGRFYGEALEAGEIRLGYDEAGFSVSYYDHRFPLAIESYDDVLEPGLSQLKRTLGRSSPEWHKLLGILYVLRTLEAAEDIGERGDQIRFVKDLLWEMYLGSPAVRRFIDGNVEMLNGEAGAPESFDRLDALLRRQRFRLAFWKVATEELNYRRFFNINHLISVRVEDEAVFAATHRLVGDLVRRGLVTGLRIDHIDGLYDPKGYLARLRRHVGADTYVVVEKILERDEELPRDWDTAGTTGYDFMGLVTGLYCDREARTPLDRAYDRFRPEPTAYRRLVGEKKRLIIGKEMAGDVDNLAVRMKEAARRDRYGRDITLHGLRRAIVEVLAWFPVYRTYVSETSFSDQDRRYVSMAITRARHEQPRLRHELAFIEDFLLLRRYDDLTPPQQGEWLDVAMRFQQLSGPLMAKGYEDTFLYTYNRLLSLNEVGGSPEHFGTTIDEFHAFCAARARDWPLAMNASQTHDAKRGEDVRARLNVLTELADEWGERVAAWAELNRSKRTTIGDGDEAPDPNDEYLLYQTLLGAWPLREPATTDDEDVPEAFRERLVSYLVKAVREAKAHTGWLEPDEPYERAFVRFAERCLDAEKGNRFLASFRPFQRKVARYGIWNGLSQTLIKLTAPGVPDLYRGSELWELSLVDPDNRRPVDWALRRRLLAALDERAAVDTAGLLAKLLAAPEDGRVKLYLIARGLRTRRDHAALFRDGDYGPLAVAGGHAERVVAFARSLRDTEEDGAPAGTARRALVAAPRFLAGVVPPDAPPVGDVWGDTVLSLPDDAPRRWTDALTGRTIEVSGDGVRLADLWRHFPGALLVEAR